MILRVALLLIKEKKDPKMPAYNVFQTPPLDYQPKLEVAGCYCEWDGKVLFLKRNPNKPQGNTWGIPGGKLEAGETPHGAVVREVFEEVGLVLNDQDLEKITHQFARYHTTDYIFHIFRHVFKECPPLILGLAEHIEARWVTIPEALQLPLMKGGPEALDEYEKYLYNGRK